MHIQLAQIGKKFNREWVFKNINLDIPFGSRTAVLGSNGSGKSTLLQIISGILKPTVGSIAYQHQNKNISAELAFLNISIASPYLELIEEMTLLEMINFHFSFKNRYQNISNEELLELLGLTSSINKEIRYFSSGMKQRTKLLLAIVSDVPCVLLDEPCSNLDKQGIDWYKNLLKDYLGNRTLLICSNQEYEYEICDKSISMLDYKSA
jgi:ABC-type multidrug transport system ATPase subunit